MTVDITVFGATGFTGALVADYLGVHLPEGASWAIAGRNAGKLAAVAERVAEIGGVSPSVVIAETDDQDSMDAMASGTRVLISTVGPYLRYGEPAVRAAVTAGIGYVDLTGEPEFVDRMWLRYHDAASRSGATLVHACGFDSIPYDLGVLFTVQHLPENAPLRVRGYIRSRGTFSGGTYHSALGASSRLREAATVAKQRKGAEERPTDRRVRGGGSLSRGPEGSGWALPLPTIDPQVVLRSARALRRYGPDFSYEHFAHFRTRRMLAGTLLGGAVVVAGARFAPTRALLAKVKDPGEGPSEAERAKAWFRLRLVGEGGGRRVVTEVRGGDPGYTETATMLSESALSLAFDEVPGVTGQTTPAVAMGGLLIDRLQEAGISFTVLADEPVELVSSDD